jgi:hypothetical protein
MIMNQFQITFHFLDGSTVNLNKEKILQILHFTKCYTCKDTQSVIFQWKQMKLNMPNIKKGITLKIHCSP